MGDDPWDFDPIDTDAVALAWNDTHDNLPAPLLLTRTADRFKIGEEIGRGAMGVVVQAEDHDLRRTVAIKQLAPFLTSDPVHVRSFVEEARLTGSLDHPNIVPVHELGQRSDGQPFFAMRLLRGRPLSQVFKLLRRSDPDVVRVFTRTRLLTIFLQLCGAVEFAHSRGVLHRDLKPENVIVGDYGDVQLLDWGIAIRVDDVDAPASDELRVPAGTPGFIAPELLHEDRVVIPRRLDVYGLGALLYEMLALVRAPMARTPQGLLKATMAGGFRAPSERAPERGIPRELDDICLAAVASDPEARTPSVAALAQQVEEFLEGIREARRRAENADLAGLEADRILSRYDALEEDLEFARAVARKLQDEVAPWDSIAKKRDMWRAEDRVREVREQRAELMEEAEAQYRQALEEVQGHRPSIDGLVELWMKRLKLEEAEGDALAARRTRARIRSLDPDAAAERLRGDGRLTLHSTPPARVWLHRFDERDRLLLPADGVDLGQTPLVDAVVPHGRHLLMLEATGRAAARLPLVMPRDGYLVRRVNLVRHGENPDGMVYVPGGPCLLGGEASGYGGRRPLQETQVDAFAVSTLPVTFREYAAFLDALVARGDAQEAEARAPRSDLGEPLLIVGPDGLYRPFPRPLTATGVDPYALRTARRLPIVGVRWEDAMAFAAHRSEVLGIALTLPTAAQWEKAARGVDGRAYPWGDTWDPGFANRSGSRPSPPHLEPVGMYGMDESVYGMRDACGGAQEWCLDVIDADRRACRGGDWTEASGRSLGAPLAGQARLHSQRVGFRLVTGSPKAPAPPES